MSTKNLARTVIEGGRSDRNKEDRRLSRRLERARSRALCRDTQSLVDPDEQTKMVKYQKVYKDFADKLSPAYKWLRKQVGRRWDIVRSELFTKFDPRSLAGRHLVYDHLLPSIMTAEEAAKVHRSYGRSFYIDEDGLLQTFPTVRRSDPNYRLYPPKFITKWLGGRRVQDLGEQQYWTILSDFVLTQCTNPYCGEKHELRGRMSVHGFWVQDKYCMQGTTWRQGPVLSPQDKSIWFSMSKFQRSQYQTLTAKQSLEAWRERQREYKAQYRALGY